MEYLILVSLPVLLIVMIGVADTLPFNNDKDGQGSHYEISHRRDK